MKKEKVQVALAEPRSRPCSADILVCGFWGLSCPVFLFLETGDWKVARTRRLESLRYGGVIAA
jgi:hypothetical protein